MSQRKRGPANSHPPAPGRRRRRAAPPQGKRQPPKRQPKEDQAGFLDIHIRAGLDDQLIRMAPGDFQRFLIHWVLAKEDIILRARGQNGEHNIVLRGSDGGAYTVRAANKNAKVTRYFTVRAIDMRAEMLEKQVKAQQVAAQQAATQE